MKTALATLQFLGYNVLALNYEENTTQLQQNTAPIELTPHFSRKILHVNDTIYAVIITVQIDQDNLPFKCQVSLKGTFNVNNIDNINKCLQVNFEFAPSSICNACVLPCDCAAAAFIIRNISCANSEREVSSIGILSFSFSSTIKMTSSFSIFSLLLHFARIFSLKAFSIQEVLRYQSSAENLHRRA